MARRGIGIEITSSRVLAVQARVSRRSMRIERTFAEQVPVKPGENGAPLSDSSQVIREMWASGGFSHSAPVAVSMPHDAVFYKLHHTDFQKVELVHQVLKNELEDEVPLDYEDMIPDVVDSQDALRRNHVLLAGAVHRQALDEHHRLFQDCGLNADIMEANICALHNALMRTHLPFPQSTFACIQLDHDHFTVVLSREGHLVTGRDLRTLGPDGAAAGTNRPCAYLADHIVRELDLTWRSALGAETPDENPLVIIGVEEGPAQELAQAISQHTAVWQPHVINPLASVRMPSGLEALPEMTLALGLAIRAADESAPGMNFLAARTRRTTQAAETRRGLIVSALLLAGIAASWLAQLFLTKDRLEEENRNLKKQIRAVFQKALPDEKNIVDEQAQLMQHFHRLKTEYETLSSVMQSDLSQVRILEILSARITKDLKITLSRISVAEGTIRVIGHANDFNTVEKVRTRLTAVPEFKEVKVQDAQKSGQGQTIKFTLLINTQ